MFCKNRFLGLLDRRESGWFNDSHLKETSRHIIRFERLAMIKCKNCGRENDDSFKFCLDCGINLKPVPLPIVEPAKATSEPQETISSVLRSESLLRAESEAGRIKPLSSGPVLPVESPPPVPPVDSPVAAVTAGATVVCQHCGNSLRPGDVFCAACGKPKSQEAPRPAATVYMHVASPESKTKLRARLVQIKSDGSEGAAFTLTGERTVIGREHGEIIFPKDLYISPRHAEITFKADQLTLIDLDSQNGIYWKMTTETRIVPGTYFRIGRQLLRLEVPGDLQPLQLDAPGNDTSRFWGSPTPQIWARLVQILEGGKIGEIHLLSLAEVTLGREQGDVRFPVDSTVSARHCMLINRDGDCFLRDLGSSNGTFLRILKSQALAVNDRIQIGNQVLRIDIQ